MPGKSGENEQNINLKIAQTLQLYLEESGSYVVMTRADLEAVGDTKRSDLLNRKETVDLSGADILVSIHQNSFPSANVKGAQVFYHLKSEQGKLLADCIQKELREFADQGNHMEIKPNSDYYMLKNIQIPAVIVECGFLSNPAEEAKLNTDLYQEKIAWSIYCGIVTYFESEANTRAI